MNAFEYGFLDELEKIAKPLELLEGGKNPPQYIIPGGPRKGYLAGPAAVRRRRERDERKLIAATTADENFATTGRADGNEAEARRANDTWTEDNGRFTPAIRSADRDMAAFGAARARLPGQLEAAAANARKQALMKEMVAKGTATQMKKVEETRPGATAMSENKTIDPAAVVRASRAALARAMGSRETLSGVASGTRKPTSEELHDFFTNFDPRPGYSYPPAEVAPSTPPNIRGIDPRDHAAAIQQAGASVGRSGAGASTAPRAAQAGPASTTISMPWMPQPTTRPAATAMSREPVRGSPATYGLPVGVDPRTVLRRTFQDPRRPLPSDMSAYQGTVFPHNQQ